jgi:nicotinamide-nucleotide amidase
MAQLLAFESPQSHMPVEIIVVGNELLNGTVLDTNSHWLSKQLNRIGLSVSRKTTVPDDIRLISEIFKEAAKRKPSWIFSIGGLGPTFDDLTLQGLARAKGVRVEKDPKALRFLKESFDRRRGLLKGSLQRRRMHRASLKMAEIPEGSTPLPNPVGSAPAVLAKLGSTKIVTFPGVPNEMKELFKRQVLPLLQRDYSFLSKRKEVWISSTGIGESQISKSTLLLMKKFRGEIYLKSHPVGYDKEGNPLLRFQLISMNSPSSDHYLNEAADFLERKIRNLGASSSRTPGPKK